MTEQSIAPLVEIGGLPLRVLASAGAEDRARAAGERIARARRHLAGVLGAAPDVTVSVLTREDWRAHATFPLYGMPHFADERTVVLAGEDNEFWRSIVPAETELSAAQRARLHGVYGAPDGRLRLGAFFDLLAIHELAHLVHLQSGRDFPRLWLAELFSNLCLHSYVAADEPGLLPVLETLPAVTVDLGHERFAHHALEDLERLYVGVGPVNYAWYQCRLHVAAGRLHGLGGDDLLRRFMDRLLGVPGGRGDGDLMDDLDAVHPALRELAAAWPR